MSEKKEKTEKIKKPKIIRISEFAYKHLICQQCFDGKDVYFLAYDTVSHETTQIEGVEIDHVAHLNDPLPGVEFKNGSPIMPIYNKELLSGQILLPSDVEEYDSDEALVEEIKEFLNRWHEPISETERMLDVCYIMLTYFAQMLPEVPYRRMLAPYGKGKSAWLQTVGAISKRPIVTAGSSTAVSLLRLIDRWRGTALIDEADFPSSDEYAFITKLLVLGYNRRTGWYSRAADKSAQKTLMYCVYGPKLLATRKKFQDMALESRCITGKTQENRRPIPLFRNTRFDDEAETLRNKLLLWYFNHYSEMRAKVESLEDPNLPKMIFGDNAKKISSRVQEVLIPLTLIGSSEVNKKIVNFGQMLDAKLKGVDVNYLLKLQIKDAVNKLVDSKEAIWLGSEYAVNLTKISYELLSREREMEGISWEKITPGDLKAKGRQVMKLLTAELGFAFKIKRHVRWVMIPRDWLKSEQKFL